MKAGSPLIALVMFVVCLGIGVLAGPAVRRVLSWAQAATHAPQGARTSVD